MTLAAHPTPRPSLAGLWWRLPVAVTTGSVLSWMAAIIGYLGLWGLGLAEREGVAPGFLLAYQGVYVVLLLVVLVGSVLLWRVLLRRAWWLAVPSLALGPLALAAQTGIL